MMVGLLLISMLAGGAVSAALAMLGQPVWILLLAYMATGAAILMVELLLAAIIVSGRVAMPQAITARFRAARLRQ